MSKAHLNCLTQYTREQMEGKANPTRDMTNYKAIQKPQRKKLWEARMARERANASTNS